MAGGAALFTDGQTEIWANAFELRRARGFQATISWLTFDVESFPAGFKVLGLSPGDLAKVPKSAASKVEAALKQAGTKPVPRPKRIGQVGAFACSYVDRDGKTYTVDQTPCYVVAVEVVKWHHQDSPATLRLRFADARYLWERGVLSRWSFNRLRADSSIAADSLNPDTGLPWKLSEATAKVASDFPLAHEVSHVPSDFATSTPQLDLPPGSQPIYGLATIAREHNLLAPCLRWDNTLALHRAGDGALGWGKDNGRAFPPGLFPNLQGNEQGYRIEPTFRPDYVIVQGGQRIVTVALDNAEPVLEDESGNLEPITEELIRRITGDRFGLKWLNEVVLQPEDLQSIPGLSEGVQMVIKEQAYRLYRVPGVEVDSDVPLLSDDVGPDGTRQPIPGRFVKKAGPNAHLLPVLPRAESTGAGRLAPTVETFAYGPVHRAVRGNMTEEELQALEIDKQLARQKKAIQAFIRGEGVDGETTVLGAAAATFLGQGDPWDGGRIGGIQLGQEVVTGLLRHAQEVNSAEGNPQQLVITLVSKEEFFALLRTARIVERIKAISPGAASERAKLLTQKYTLRDVFSPDPGWGPIFSLCLKIAALETQLNERIGFVDTIGVSTEEQINTALAESPDLNESIVGEVLSVARAVTAERRKRQLLTDVGAVNQGTPTPIVGFENKFTRSFVNSDGERVPRIVRDVDTGAQLVDAKRGLFRLSRLPGHLADPGVTIDDASTFVPKPVRLIFGAVARPPVDGLLQGSATGPGSRATVDSDRETLYESWWQRTGAGALNKIDPSVLNAERYAEIRRQAIPLQRPDLFELVGLNDQSNRDELDKEAKVAAGAVLEGADKIESAAWTVARPFPVNCDGIVAAVTIRSRPGGLGIETVIETGDEPILSEPLRTSTRQRPRFRPGDPSREGGAA